MQSIDLSSAAHLIDFSGGNAELASLARQQLEGSVALLNMLAHQRVAYLADEVGMGKTYIALGVVALMRRLQPHLRVLYLLPKNNVRDKWVKDYRSFIAKNYRVTDLRVKGLQQQPAAPSRICHSLNDLVQAIATGDARDFFICTSAFSQPLGEDVDTLKRSLDKLYALLPQTREQSEGLLRTLSQANASGATTLAKIKKDLKELWAKSLNAILPQFDLVVVDEAHNYRHGKESSQRNALMAEILGSASQDHHKVKQLLLLSATPFDRDPHHLRNQLKLFGHGDIYDLPNRATRDEIQAFLSRLMVRRLNEIHIEQKAHSRNMYRDEHRTGPTAEVELKLEQQLFAALLQKKVSEHLQETCHGRYEQGLMTCFESYLPADKDKPIIFDGLDDTPAGKASDREAPDRGIVETLVTDYQHHFSEMPPHPKMDGVAVSAVDAAFQHGKKQLLFTRRVRSVSELKFKMETEYDRWLAAYVAQDATILHWLEHYKKGRKLEHALQDEVGQATEDPGPGIKNDFFSWFYLGQNSELEKASQHRPEPLPHNFRNSLNTYSLFAINWAQLPGMPAATEVSIDWLKLIPPTKESKTSKLRFDNAQYAYLNAVAQGPYESAVQNAARAILKAAYPHFVPGVYFSDPQQLAAELTRTTFWQRCQMTPGLESLAPPEIHDSFAAIAAGNDTAIRKMLIHQRLAALVCRLDHPFIDLYALRNHSANKHMTVDEQLCSNFIDLLATQQQAQTDFCSYQILRDIASNLDLLIKLNFEQAYDMNITELTRYLTNQIAPLSPIAGATGENVSSRSYIARRFRMPGYPRLLISTNVFQEGEDLHTFCDSVVHYGLSASPIALEQKVGRVDRIASLAHRNIQADPAHASKHFIQVYYPHIRQSLEYLQVRQAAANLNAFQLSLHEVDKDHQQFSSEVEVLAQLRDSSAVLPQLRIKLNSPFGVTSEQLKGTDHLDQLQSDDQRTRERLDYVCQTVSHSLSIETDQPIELHPKALSWQGEVELHGLVHPLAIQIHTSAGHPELILVIRNLAPMKDERGQTLGAGAIKLRGTIPALQSLQSNPLTRLKIMRASDDDEDVIVREAQVFAGGKNILAPIEIRDTFQRATMPWQSLAPVYLDAAAPLSDLLKQTESTPHFKVTLIYPSVARFEFIAEQRIQDVAYHIWERYLVIHSKVIDRDTLRTYEDDADFLISLTLGRNAKFDTIDFHIDQDGGLSVRALHPLEHLNLEELRFLSLKVAAEADRLQHILTCGEDDERESEEEDSQDIRAERIALDDTNRIMYIIRCILHQGATTRQELIKSIAYEMGYERTGKNIAATLNNHIRTAVRRGIARNENGDIRLEAASILDYNKSFLKDQFLAALSSESAGFVDRAVAMTAWVRWLGYARTGQNIEAMGRSLINGLLREDRLEAQQDQIRRRR